MDANTCSFAISQFRSLADEATKRADTAHWNSDAAATIVWAGRAHVCTNLCTVLKRSSSCVQVRATIATGATTSTSEISQAWQLAADLFEEVIAWRVVDWSSSESSTAIGTH